MSTVEYTWRDSELRSRPVRSVPPSGGGSPWKRPDKRSTSTWRAAPSAARSSKSDDDESMSTVEYTWRDSELRSRPVRALNWTGAQVARFGHELPSLRPSSVIAAAAKKAGSDDFGSDSYREPLEVYLRACEEEAELTTFGRLLVSKMLAGALANRIELQRWSNDHPEVREGRIERPWIIVGLPRTGTSLLSILLGLDPVARPLLQWEAAHPVPPTTLEAAAEDPRIARHAKDLDGLMKLNPPLKAMHPFGATVAEECVAIFMYDVRALAL
jgi:Sulfotransferase family